MMARKIFHLSTLLVGMLMLFSSVPLTAQDNSSKPISQPCRCLGHFGASQGLGQTASHTAIWIS